MTQTYDSGFGSGFDRDTDVRPTVEEGRYEADLSAGWTVGGGLNGGYLMATLGRAVSRRARDLGHPDPLALSAYFLSAATPGPAQARVEVLRAGRGTSTLSGTLTQDGVQRLTVLSSYVDLGSLTPEVATTATPPALAPVEQCVPTSEDPMAPEFSHRFELRLDPACLGFASGTPGGRAVMEGWFRLVDGREPDPISLLLAADALPPTTFELGRPGWAPTVEMSVHVRARPAPGWLALRHVTTNLAGGYFEEDCEVWDSAGRLVAQARQLAKTPRG
ncbi:hypothetical protein GCM10011519_30880 [Marmoricola endophyticus]|uniref:Thioesterase family protein n=1 Tax=Marmoricola endophyticus TaxID=2040280 RepID=A0A917BQ99_9ACTN|nr:thioesterase family protein [Marmoricola endophyticus]GGF54781.1 hypothetical protein GCM10011519_30880 [Marmoricola endophyticus]